MGFAIAKWRRFSSAAGAGLVLVALGCASGPPKSGFLSDYSALKKVHDDAPVWSFVDPEGVGRAHRTLKLWADTADWMKLAGYDKVMMDPIVLRLGKNSSGRWVSPGKLKELTDRIHEDFVSELSADYPVVDEAGEGVVRFRTAITDVYPMSRFRSAHGVAAADWAYSHAGGLAFEVELVDSVSGDRVIAVVGSGRGSKTDPQSDKGIWDNAVSVSGRFGAFIRERMNMAHESGSKQP